MNPTLNFSHQYHIFDPKDARQVTIIGVGSVGSHVAMFLARMGIPSITVWDDDSVTSHNIPMSIYGMKDIGRPKVEALKEKIFEETGVEIIAKKEMFRGTPLRNTSVVSCVDDMENTGRCLIWTMVKRNPTVDILCDTRTAGAFIEVLSIDPSSAQDITRYELLLFKNSEATRQMCGTHGVVYGSARAAGIVVANLNSFWVNGEKAWRVAERCDTLERVL